MCEYYCSLGVSMDSAVDRAFEAVCLVEANVREDDEWLGSTEGDAPVCTCKLADDAEQGCEEGCLNRSMRFECAVELCPCGECCSNRQLQFGSTVPTAVVDCGDKGVGVITLEDVEVGRFIGEYVGEVISRDKARIRCQLYRNERHFYMLQLNADEVIDATRIGGRMRFVNHSCEPNCQVEKWSVRGQERCGLFAIQCVKAGDELTFDYRCESTDAERFECLCSTTRCRGSIGLLNRKRQHESSLRQSLMKKRYVQLTMDSFLQK
ncbi:hypothetical protein DVH05_000031 [Phytophthora capsici]|nr:hypothetical protein DVH05_000031 [Phytophthora capsici]